MKVTRVNMKVDREIQRRLSKNGQDRIFAPKLDNPFCPMTVISQGKSLYPLLGQSFQPVSNIKLT